MNPSDLEQLAPGVQDRATEPDGASSSQAPAAWLVRLMLAAFAVGIPADNLLVRYLGSSSVIGVPLALAAAWQVLTTGRIRRAPPTLLWLTAFGLWSMLSVLWARNFVTVDVDLQVSTRVQLLALVWMGWQVLGSGREARAVLVGYLAGCVIVVADSWRVYRAGGLIAGYARYYAEGFNPNHLAVTLAFGIPMAAYLALSGGRRAYLSLLYVPIALSGIALSASRSGALTAAIAISAVLAWMVAHRRASLGWMIALILGGLAAAVTLVPAESWGRILTIRSQLETGSVGDRTVIWRAGLSVFAANPFIGVGVGNFREMVVPILGYSAVAHNTPLSVATETGIVGLVLLLAVPAASIWATRRCSRNDRAFVTALMIVWLVGTSAGTWEEDKQTWLLYLIGAAIGALGPARTPSQES